MAETFKDEQRFQLGFMDDAAECFVGSRCAGGWEREGLRLMRRSRSGEVTEKASAGEYDGLRKRALVSTSPRVVFPHVEADSEPPLLFVPSGSVCLRKKAAAPTQFCAFVCPRHLSL